MIGLKDSCPMDTFLLRPLIGHIGHFYALDVTFVTKKALVFVFRIS